MRLFHSVTGRVNLLFRFFKYVLCVLGCKNVNVGNENGLFFWMRSVRLYKYHIEWKHVIEAVPGS